MEGLGIGRKSCVYSMDYITAIWYLSLAFGILTALWYIFPVLVHCVKKNLATLHTYRAMKKMNDSNVAFRKLLRGGHKFYLFLHENGRRCVV
jgi:hypothetical protein